MSNDSFKPVPVKTIDSVEALKVYFDPARQRIMQHIAHEPQTAQQIADTLDVPFTRLYYHIRLLEKHGIIQLVETKLGAGAIEEKYYQITARQFVVDRRLLTVGDVDKRTEALSIILDTVFEPNSALIRESVDSGLIDLNVNIPHEDAFLARRGTLTFNAEQARQFQTDLINLLTRYQDMPTEEGNPYNFVISMFRIDIDDPEF